VWPFIEAEKVGQLACELLCVSRAAFYQHEAGPCARDLSDAEMTERSRRSTTRPRAPTGCPGSGPSSAVTACPAPRSGSLG
jgi:hypothetical protein